MAKTFEKVTRDSEKRAEPRTEFEAVVRVHVAGISPEASTGARGGVLTDISAHGIGMLVSMPLNKGDRFCLEADYADQHFPSVVSISPRGCVPLANDHYVVAHCSKQPHGSYAVGAMKAGSRS